MYTGVIHAIREMYKENGIRTFYKGEITEIYVHVLLCTCIGLVPTLTQIAPYIGLQFGIYTTSVAVWKKLSGVCIVCIAGP